MSQITQHGLLGQCKGTLGKHVPNWHLGIHIQCSSRWIFDNFMLFFMLFFGARDTVRTLYSCFASKSRNMEAELGKKSKRCRGTAASECQAYTRRWISRRRHSCPAGSQSPSHSLHPHHHHLHGGGAFTEQDAALMAAKASRTTARKLHRRGTRGRRWQKSPCRFASTLRPPATQASWPLQTKQLAANRWWHPLTESPHVVMACGALLWSIGKRRLPFALGILVSLCVFISGARSPCICPNHGSKDGLRIGEASNPGPASPFDCDEPPHDWEEEPADAWPSDDTGFCEPPNWQDWAEAGLL